jgi:hypothetical protein
MSTIHQYYSPRRHVLILLGAFIGLIACGSESANVDAALNDLRVFDGDTISADGKHYRPIGLDAPETRVRARCTDEARRGRLAKSRLRDIVKTEKLALVRFATGCEQVSNAASAQVVNCRMAEYQLKRPLLGIA